MNSVHVINMNLIGKVFYWSVAATNAPDVVQMNHSVIH